MAVGAGVGRCGSKRSLAREAFRPHDPIMRKEDKIDLKKEIPFIRRRCPHLGEEELREAEERFREYVRLCLEIHGDGEYPERPGGGLTGG